MPWKEATARWRACTRCPEICETRKVFARGSIDADILFLGMSPGEEEERRGKPFVGPSGKLLDEACGLAKPPHRSVEFAWVNLVACRTWSIADWGGKRNRDPRGEEIANCRPILLAQIRYLKPRNVVALGKLAFRWAPKDLVPVWSAWHPAYICRQPQLLPAYVRQLSFIFRKALGIPHEDAG